MYTYYSTYSETTSIYAPSVSDNEWEIFSTGHSVLCVVKSNVVPANVIKAYRGSNGRFTPGGGGGTVPTEWEGG